MTYDGGTLNGGVVFKIKPDGTGYTKLLDFDGTNGANPYGSLISDGVFLYGMTSAGGTMNYGVIFKIKPDGTEYSKLLDFEGASSGRYPYGSLLFEGIFLYGMTYNGGANNLGVIFKIKPDGTEYAKLLDFGNSNGEWPWGSLISDGTFLYGMTWRGGTNDKGVIFKLKPDGTGFSKLLVFDGLNGQWPYGDLFFDGTFLYGMTYFGGTGATGNVFKIKPDGTGYSDLFDFVGASNGRYPRGSLISDGTFLYAMTWQGGTNNYGDVFKIKPDGTGYSKLFDFIGSSNGSLPRGSLISDGTFMYGMANQGGTNDMGTLFKYTISTGMEENGGKSNIQIYPNPNVGKFNLLVFDNEYSVKEIKVYTILGEKVFQSTISNQQTNIDLSKQPDGIYFLNIKTEKESFTQKVMVQK